MVATPCLQWSPSPTTILLKKQAINDGILNCRSVWLGTMSSKLCRTRTFHFGAKQSPISHSSTISRACYANFDGLSDEEFSRKIEDLTFRFQLSDADDAEKLHESPSRSDSAPNSEPKEPSMESRWNEIDKEPPDWPASIEMRANSGDLPLSLRMIKQKKKKNVLWQEGLVEAGESAYCSVKKAFSSMVFIIRELHSYTLQMREFLFYEDLRGILATGQKEMHASFVWLFQHVFSHTPILMVHVMILLANFTVYSMSTSAAIASVPPPTITATLEERESGTTTTIVDKLDAPTIKSGSNSLSFGKTTSVGGGDGGGSNVRPAASGTEGDGGAQHRSENLHRPVLGDGGVSPFTAREEDSKVSEAAKEMELWNSIVDEASRMQAEVRDKVLDHETVKQFVSPVTAKIDGDGEYEEYSRTELFYQTGLVHEPNNVLLLANYAQYLYLVAHDNDRAEEYFKKATAVEPKDAEAYDKYAVFLWQVRKDLWAAEETFLEAISADPTTSHYAANYAHFLWSTGAEDTCFPLDDQS